MKKLILSLILVLLLATPSLAQRFTRGSGGSGGTLAIGSGVTGGTANRVLFLDGSGLLADDADFTFASDILTTTGGYKTGDNTDQSFCIMTVDLLAGDQTICWDDVNNEFDFSAPINASGTGQSALNQGLVVNDGGGGTDEDDFRVETDSEDNFIVVDASQNGLTIGDSDTNYVYVNTSAQMGFVGGAALILPASATLPVTCTAGELYQDNDATTQEQLYLCESTDTWAAVGSGGGGATAKLTVELPVQSARVTGSFVTDGDATQGAEIDSSEGPTRLLFDDTTDEAAVWQFRMPNNYSSDPLLKVGYSMASATSLDVEFEGAIMCISDGDSADIGTASFSTIAVATETVPGTAGYPSEVSITLTDDSCAANDTVFVYLSTDSDDATNDDATGDREVVHATLAYTGS